MLVVSRFIEGDWDEAKIREAVRLDTLGDDARAVFERIACGAPGVQCLWGALRIASEEVGGGLRFHVQGCANSLQWTVTRDEGLYHGGVRVHCTLTQPSTDETLATSVNEFVDTLTGNVTSALNGRPVGVTGDPAAVSCGHLATSSYMD